ncbi:MAG: TonB family protein [Pseudomonadota bacterium]
MEATLDESESGGGRRVDIIVASIAFVLVGIAGAWFLLGGSGEPPIEEPAQPQLVATQEASPDLGVAATESESAQTLANKARMALNADMIAEPAGQNALYYYSLALEADPENGDVRNELNAVSDQVSTMIREHLAAEDYAAAERLVSRLELAVPSAAVLREFELTVGNRRQALLDQAVAEAGAGRQRAAGQLLEQARALPGDASASIRQTQTQLAEIADQQRAVAAEAAARRAEEQARLAASREAEQEAEPVREAAAAEEPAAPVAEPEPSGPSADVSVANSIREKVTRGALDGDGGAIAELGQALSDFPDSEAVAESRTLLLAAVESQVQRQLSADDTRAAAGSIAAVEDLPGADGVVPELKSALASTEKRLAGAVVIPASQLELVEAVPPVYPRSARRREVEGWVDIEFTVTSAGDTADVAIVDASQANTFNRATIQAVSQWQFKPRMFRGEAIDQRVKARVSFRLESS